MKKPLPKTSFTPKKTFRAAYEFFTYRRYFYIFRLKINKYRRCLYKYRR